MAKIILFGGGDGGGLIISDNGVRPIPPFDPFVRAELRAVSHLVVAGQARQGDAAELAGHAAQVANIAVQQVEAIVGPLDEEAGLIVVDQDGGGFVCGTTGRPPAPLPAPGGESLPFDSLMARGGLDSSLVTFVRRATEGGASVEDLLERPREIARDLGIEMSERNIGRLEVLAPSRIEQLEDPTSREVVTFFQRVLTDGRYVDTWAIRPAAVSEAIGLPLSDEAANRIIRVGSAMRGRIGGEAGIIWIVVGIIVVVAVVVDEDEAEILDRSGISKF